MFSQTRLLLMTLLMLSLYPLHGFADARDDYWRGYHMGYGPGMMGAGMMGGPHMGFCPMSNLDNVQMNIVETKDGVTVTYTAKDKKDIQRLQKMAQIMKLTQEMETEKK